MTGQVKTLQFGKKPFRHRQNMPMFLISINIVFHAASLTTIIDECIH